MSVSPSPMKVLDRLVARALPLAPRGLVWKVARRYVAGTSLEDAARVVEDLSARGLRATVDFLGESVRSRDQAERARETYRAVLVRLHRGGLPSGISVKLSQLGLQIDPDLARANLEALLDAAAGLGRFVRIDMEDSSTTEATLSIYRDARSRHPNVGVVLQAYLRRTLADVRALLPLCPDVRICKGIYIEPPSLAFQGFEEVQRNFLAALRLLLEGGARAAIATHDPFLVEESIRLTDQLRIGPERHEFQMLLGVGKQLHDRLAAAGRKLRIYVPFGEDWYPYCLRRLRENPRLAGYVFRDLITRR